MSNFLGVSIDNADNKKINILSWNTQCVHRSKFLFLFVFLLCVRFAYIVTKLVANSWCLIACRWTKENKNKSIAMNVQKCNDWNFYRWLSVGFNHFFFARIDRKPWFNSDECVQKLLLGIKDFPVIQLIIQ